MRHGSLAELQKLFGIHPPAWSAVLEKIVEQRSMHDDNLFRLERAYPSPFYVKQVGLAKEWVAAYDTLISTLVRLVFLRGKTQPYKCPHCKGEVLFCVVMEKHIPFCEACAENLRYTLMG